MGNYRYCGPLGAIPSAIDAGTLCLQTSQVSGLSAAVQAAAAEAALAEDAGMVPAQPLAIVEPGAGLPEELKAGYDDYVKALTAYVRENRHYWTQLMQDALDYGSGTLSNLEGGIAWMVHGIGYGATGLVSWTWGELGGDTSKDAALPAATDALGEAMDSDLATGCLDCQAQTLKALKAHLPATWVAEKWIVGNVMEHHAVNVHLKSEPAEKGFMFDPWIQLKPIAVTYASWTANFRSLGLLGAPRAEH